jgi:hypothetical protein
LKKQNKHEKYIVILLLFICSIAANAQNNDILKQLNNKYSTGLFTSDNAHFLVPMHDGSANGNLNLLQYLQGRVPGLIIYAGGIRPTSINYRGGYPALFLDEVQVDAMALSSVHMNDVAIIKVFRPPFLAAFRGGVNGAIAVYTKDGDEYEEGN